LLCKGNASAAVTQIRDIQIGKLKHGFDNSRLEAQGEASPGRQERRWSCFSKVKAQAQLRRHQGRLPPKYRAPENPFANLEWARRGRPVD